MEELKIFIISTTASAQLLSLPFHFYSINHAIATFVKSVNV
ncbi:hypothetical protein [Metallosphaera hakonensis]|nr:hypothetical protein [Metallosphaera hakonensis]